MIRNRVSWFCILIFLSSFTSCINDTTKKRGPNFKVTLEDQKNVYLQFQDFFRNSIPPYTSDVYNRIQRVLDYKMSKRSINLSVKRNYVYFFGAHECASISRPSKLSQSGVEEISRSSSLSETSSQDSQDSSRYVLISDVPDTHKKSFVHFFCIDKITWEEVSPTHRYYGRNEKKRPDHAYRKKLKLKINKWTNVIQAKLWEALKLCCTWCFKTNICKKQFDVTMKGYCKQCHANITISTLLKTENLIELKCIITNFDDHFKHSVKVKNHVRKHKRNTLSETMKYESAACVRYKMASQVMEEHDKEPPVLPKLETLWQIKHESRKSLLFHENPILSLSNMRVTPRV